MKQYIDKDALVEEIKRRKELVSDPILSGNDLIIGERNAYFNLLSFIDAIEVEDGNLEEEIKSEYNPIDGLSFEDFERIAKHFFELGMAASNKQSDAYIEGVKGGYTTITK